MKIIQVKNEKGIPYQTLVQDESGKMLESVTAITITVSVDQPKIVADVTFLVSSIDIQNMVLRNIYVKCPVCGYTQEVPEVNKKDGL